MGGFTKRAVSAAEANRNVSAVLRAVRNGRTVVVTSHGMPVAKMVPFRQEDRARDAARSLLVERLRRQKVINAGRWTGEMPFH